MVDSLLDSILSNLWLSPFIVFFAGLLTAFNPCVLVGIPLIVGASGAYQGQDKSYKKSILFTFFFVLGLSISFSILGIIASLVGFTSIANSQYWGYVVAVICIFMGLMFADIIQINISVPKTLLKPRAGLFGALLLGFVFGFVSTPCAVPIIIVLMSFLSTGGNIVLGGFLLFMYAVGHSVLIFAAGVSVGAVQAYINNKKLTDVSKILKTVFGLIITIFGLYLLWIA